MKKILLSLILAMVGGGALAHDSNVDYTVEF